jgi:hypothetical protein
MAFRPHRRMLMFKIMGGAPQDEHRHHDAHTA